MTASGSRPLAGGADEACGESHRLCTFLYFLRITGRGAADVNNPNEHSSSRGRRRRGRRNQRQRINRRSRQPSARASTSSASTSSSRTIKATRSRICSSPTSTSPKTASLRRSRSCGGAVRAAMLRPDADGNYVPAVTFNYDANGNITSSSAASTTTSFAYNGANELCWAYIGSSSNSCSSPPSGATTYIFDANGNETANSAGASFGYNPKNQTTSITYGGSTLSPLTYTGTDQTQRTAAGSTTFDSGPSGVQVSTISGSSTNRNSAQALDSALMTVRRRILVTMNLADLRSRRDSRRFARDWLPGRRAA